MLIEERMKVIYTVMYIVHDSWYPMIKSFLLLQDAKEYCLKIFREKEEERRVYFEERNRDKVYEPVNIVWSRDLNGRWTINGEGRLHAIQENRLI